MLLPGIYHILMNLCLSKAENSQTKIWLYLGAKLAKNMEQVNYLKKSRDENIFPNTIDNLKFPSCFNDRGMQSSSVAIKRLIIRKMIRFSNGQVAKTKTRLINELTTIFQSYGRDKAILICSAVERAFQISQQFHKERLEKKLRFKKAKMASPAPRRDVCPLQIRAEQVTDLTGSLDQSELQLLSKGPKFALSNGVRELDIKANFCQLAYQLRWQHYLNQQKLVNPRPNVPPFPKYPHSGFICTPPANHQELEAELRQ